VADDVVIRAEGLGKRYRIGQRRERYASFREAMEDGARRLARGAADLARGRGLPPAPNQGAFWALKDVSFEVRRGEVLGVIGRNGAGKSTLLKILSRITEPSEGRVTIDGRVASLLEVGTGFHQELTGRENIYLNGAILGMSHAEIRRKFDEIVDFSGVETFLDTPVKRYSSGMQVRLAFSVAAHLEPEILVVDEVLAVGDAEFQKKCLGKMDEVSSREGRTVLFVSHQLGMVARLCERGMLLSQGRIAAVGPTRHVLDNYKSEVAGPAGARASAGDGKDVYIASVDTFGPGGQPTSEFYFDEEITVRAIVEGKMSNPGLLLTVTLVGKDGDYVTTTVVPLQERLAPGCASATVAVTLPAGVIAPNEYHFRLALFSPPSSVFDLHEFAAPVSIRDSGSPMAAFEGGEYGHVILDCRSEVAPLEP
jgi:lipopolysaccharide transport system ATP-binding protein